MTGIAKSPTYNDDGHAEPPPSYVEAIADTQNRTANAPQNTYAPIAGPSAARPIRQQPNNLPQIARQFPPTFGIYSVGWGGGYTLGEHKDQVLYAVSTHTGWSGQPAVVLHTGPRNSLPLMAAVDFQILSHAMTITLPALPGRGVAGKEEELSSKFNGWSRIHGFSVEVDLASGRREEFEWRHSSGDAITALGADHFGWKLVRMATSPHAAHSSFTTKDGKEVVAAWSRTSMRGSKVAKFQFLGTGETGLLGERWAIMAVVTALGIYERERRDERHRST
jgi:hypothetical protein